MGRIRPPPANLGPVPQPPGRRDDLVVRLLRRWAGPARYGGRNSPFKAGRRWSSCRKSSGASTTTLVSSERRSSPSAAGAEQHPLAEMIAPGPRIRTISPRSRRGCGTPPALRIVPLNRRPGCRAPKSGRRRDNAHSAHLPLARTEPHRVAQQDRASNSQFSITLSLVPETGREKGQVVAAPQQPGRPRCASHRPPRRPRLPPGERAFGRIVERASTPPFEAHRDVLRQRPAPRTANCAVRRGNRKSRSPVLHRDQRAVAERQTSAAPRAQQRTIDRDPPMLLLERELAMIGDGALPIVATIVRVPIDLAGRGDDMVPVAATPVLSLISMPRFSRKRWAQARQRLRQLGQHPVGEFQHHHPHLGGVDIGIELERKRSIISFIAHGLDPGKARPTTVKVGS